MRSRIEGSSQFIHYLDKLIELVIKADTGMNTSFNAQLNKLKQIRVQAEQSVFMDSICMSAAEKLASLKVLFSLVIPFKILDTPAKNSTR